MSKPPQTQICEHYEACFEEHGDTPQGVDWPNLADARIRYQVMLDLIPKTTDGTSQTLLDFGCGTAALLEFIQEKQIPGIEYSGLDLSPAFTDAASSKFPGHDFLCLDLLEEGESLPVYDYLVMNGVFTEKLGVSFDEMLAYLMKMLTAAFAHCRKGMAFNVMSKHVDWEREDLFHLPFDVLAPLLNKSLSRHHVFRSDYGLYEYTVYLYKEPQH